MARSYQQVQRRALRQTNLVQPPVPVEPTAEPSTPTDTVLTPGKVTKPQELPLGEMISTRLPVCGTRASAFPPRTDTMSAALPIHDGAGCRVVSPGCRTPAQRPSN